MFLGQVRLGYIRYWVVPQSQDMKVYAQSVCFPYFEFIIKIILFSGKAEIDKWIDLLDKKLHKQEDVKKMFEWIDKQIEWYLEKIDGFTNAQMISFIH